MGYRNDFGQNGLGQKKIGGGPEILDGNLNFHEAASGRDLKNAERSPNCNATPFRLGSRLAVTAKKRRVQVVVYRHVLRSPIFPIGSNPVLRCIPPEWIR